MLLKHLNNALMIHKRLKIGAPRVIKIFREEKMAYKLMTLGIFGVMVWFLINVAVNVIAGAKIPNEILEPSNVALTNLFIEGKSPYTLSALEWEIPGINYDYPFLASLAAAGISKLTGLSAAAAHYLLSYMSMLLSGIVGYLIIRKYALTTVAPVLGAFLFLLCHWRFGFISAAPDDFGLLLFLLTLYCAVMPGIKNKPPVCAIGVTLCFYTKQYFVFAALGIFIYFLFYSRREAIRFFLYTVIINIVAGVLITIFWPLYWTYSVFFLYIGCFSGTGSGFGYLLGQLKYLAAIFIGLFAVLVVALVKIIRKMRAEHKKFDSLCPKENDALSLFVIQIPVMFFPLVFFGRNDGAFLSYFLQLWMPSIVVVALIAFERMKPEKREWLYQGIYAGVIMFTVYFGLGKLPMHKITQEEQEAWDRANAYVDEYREYGEVYYARSLAYRAFEEGRDDCICGHDGELSKETLELWENSQFLKRIFPHAGDIINKVLAYRVDLQLKASLHDYSLVTFEEDGYSMIFAREFLEEMMFEYLDEMDLQLGNMSYHVVFYKAEPFDEATENELMEDEKYLNYRSRHGKEENSIY